MSGPPAWERLRAVDRTPLTVAPPRRLRVTTLRIDDGDLPSFDSATVFDARRAAEGFVIRAARIEGSIATTYEITTGRLQVRASDAALARLLGFEPGAPPEDVEWIWLEPTSVRVGATDEVVCPCEGIGSAEVRSAIEGGCRTVDAVKRATKATFGVCQSRNCALVIGEMIGLPADDPRARITPRPPLVPVPTSVLAAFADPGELG